MSVRKAVVFLYCVGIFSISFFYCSPEFNRNVLIKNFAFELFCSLTLLLSLYLLARKRLPIKLSVSTLDIFITSLFVCYSFFLISSKARIHENFLCAYYLAFYLALRLIAINYESEIEGIVSGLAVVAPIAILTHIVIILLQLNGIFPSLNANFKDGGTFGSPDAVGSYVAIALPFCFNRIPRWRQLGFAVVCISVVVLVYIQARTSLLSLFIAGIVWLLLNFKISKYMILGAISSFLLMLGGLIAWHPQSFLGRVLIWRVCFNMIIDKPLGWGVNAFNVEYQKYQAEYFSLHPQILKIVSPAIVHSPFNEFLYTGVTIGLVSLLILIVSCLNIFSLNRHVKSIAFYPVLIFMIIACAYFPSSYASHTSIVILSIILLGSQGNVVWSRNITSYVVRWSALAILFLLGIFSAGSIYSYYTYNVWTNAVTMLQKRKFEDSEELFRQANSERRNDPRFLMTYGALKLAKGEKVMAVKFFKKADNLLTDKTLILELADIYSEVGQYNNALKCYKKILEILPNDFYAAYYKVLLLKRTHSDREALLEAIELDKKLINTGHTMDSYVIQDKIERLIAEYQSETNNKADTK